MNTLFSLLTTYKYAILLPAVVIEGPIVSVIASFLASLGILNVYLVFIVVMIGDLLGDNIYYWIGRIGGKRFIESHGKRFNITEEKLAAAEEKCNQHLGKTLLFGKLLQAPVLILLLAAGAIKYDYRKFIATAVMVTVPKTIMFVVLGFYFGKSYQLIDLYLKKGTWFVTAIVVIVGATYFFFKVHKKKGKDLL